jgi:hypothetical protein
VQGRGDERTAIGGGPGLVGVIEDVEPLIGGKRLTVGCQIVVQPDGVGVFQKRDDQGRLYVPSRAHVPPPAIFPGIRTCPIANLMVKILDYGNGGLSPRKTQILTDFHCQPVGNSARREPKRSASWRIPINECFSPSLSNSAAMPGEMPQQACRFISS